MKLLRVDMSVGEFFWEELDESYRLLGGRGLISALLLDNMDPGCDPEGPDNKLVFCNGLLAGSHAPGSGRLSIGSKSPLTGRIKESNAGGTAGIALARLGLRAVLLSGHSPVQRVLVIGPDGARLDDASALALRGTYESCDILRARYGAGISIICIGPAGERQYLNSSIQVTDREGYPARSAARGGLGGVMGARGLKAVVLLQGREKNVFSDAARFQAASRVYTRALFQHQEEPARRENEAGAVRAGCLSVCSLCSVPCVKRGESGTPGGGSGPEPEGNAAAFDRLCDDAGLDAMETRTTIGLLDRAGIHMFAAVEGGLPPGDDGSRELDFVRQMAQGTPLGREMGRGAERFGASIGVTDFPRLEKRSAGGGASGARKGTSGSEKALRAAFDCLGMCVFAGMAADSEVLALLGELLAALLGGEWQAERVLALGEEALAREGRFNALAAA